MSYEYTDHDGDRDVLRVYSFNHKVHVQITEEGSGWATVAVAPEDAPALALTILEAAGIEYVTTAEAANPSVYIGPERLAATSLQEWSRLRSKRAEREAEDAKVREFRESSLSAFASVFNGSITDPTGWGEISETGREGWRTRYRAARKFFEES